MIDPQLLRNKFDDTKWRLSLRGVPEYELNLLKQADEDHRRLTATFEAMRAELNRVSKDIGKWIGARKSNPSAAIPDSLDALLMRMVRMINEKPDFKADDLVKAVTAVDTPERARAVVKVIEHILAPIEAGLKDLAKKRDDILLDIPNVPHELTPIGRDASYNAVRKEWGNKPEFDFAPKPHWDLAADAGLELEIGGRITGSGFPFLRGKLARLERAMLNYFLDLHTREHAYTECWTPFMVRGETLRNSSQLPKFYDDLYRADERDDLYLIPTAEVPLTSVHAGEILKDDDTPIRYCAFTPCFRREAGAAGKDTRGILRVHQFSKVELMVVTTPEKSAEEHETLTRCAETVLETLNIPYRRLELCTGDLGFGAARCYDLEAWAAGVGKWLEVSSCSNFTDFQARRAKIRVRDKDKNTRLAHTLNGSGLAVPRTMIALLENNQTADGTINIPQALQPFYGAETL